MNDEQRRAVEIARSIQQEANRLGFGVKQERLCNWLTPGVPLSEQIRRAEDSHQRLAQKAEQASQLRASLPPGTSRARITTANARWAQYAEGRDQALRRLEWLRQLAEEQAG